MTKNVQMVRMSTALAAAYVGLAGQLIVDQGRNTLRVLDGVSPGGSAMLSASLNLSDIASPAAARANILALATTGALADLTDVPTANKNLGLFGIAGGTADALTFTDARMGILPVNGQQIRLRAISANATTTPTLNINGAGAITITKIGNQPLVPGDIFGASHELTLRYNAANNKWELLNPCFISTGWVVAGGTADAITGTFVPAISVLTDGLTVAVRATAANATTTPTFNANGLGAKTITKSGGTALSAGDIPAALAEIILRYNLPNTRWELLNPASGNFLESTVAAPGSTFSAGSGNAQNITTLSLTPGDWDVEGLINTSGATLSNMQAGINSTSATQPSGAYINTIASPSANGSVSATRRRFSLASTTTIYLVFTGFGASTPTIYGYLNARRIG